MSKREVKCPYCHKPTIVEHERVRAEIDDDMDDMTEGQMADYFSGTDSEWDVDVYEGICSNCHRAFRLTLT